MSKFSINDRIKSFKHALNGIQFFIRFEHNAWIHLFALVFVVVLSICLNISKMEWVAIVFAIGLVFLVEGINTAIEKLADSVSLEENEHIKKAKDISAGAVLIAAITAVIIGLLILLPHIIEKIK